MIQTYKLIKEANEAAELDTAAHIPHAIVKHWPTVRAALRLARIFLSKRAKTIIDGVIEWGDNEFVKV
jgi:hypothetical protein